MAYEALEKAWASAAQTIVGVSFVAPRVDGAGIGRDVGPAPAEWETANQQTLDADIREAFRQYWPPISGELEAGRTDHLGPFVVRDAARAEREKGRAQKRSALRQVELDPDSLQSHAVELTDHAAVDAIIGSLPDAAPLRVALEAMREGATKTEAAERAGWSRPTLDAHLKELGSKHRPAD